MNQRIIWTMICYLVYFGSMACAQSPLVAQDYYGRGLHAFFSGNTSQARQYLSMAIGNRPNDPRPYYFRALCELQSGSRYEAEQDMEIGATLESQSFGTYAVGQALQRVQGGRRMILERYRKKARAMKFVGQRAPQQVYHQSNEVRLEQQLWRPVNVPMEQLIGNPVGSDFVQHNEFRSPDWIRQAGGRQTVANSHMADDAIADNPGSLPSASSNSTDPFRDDTLESTPESESSTEEKVDAKSKLEAGNSGSIESEPTEEVDPFGGDVSEDDPFGSF